MTDETLRRAHALFERLVDLPEAERGEILRIECAQQPALEAVVVELLEADRRTHAVLDSDADAVLAVLEGEHDRDGSAVGAGDRIGKYRLIREVGRGGMATVYLAERDVGGGVQSVALKLVRRGLDTDDVISRFAHETRLLASLEHPHIARFYDAGVSPDGRPFLVMEYVEGSSLTRYSDDRRLNVASRLGLYRTVCDAVQFAHHRLVVHRDLKPSNILVTAQGEVKLLDFGIAKLLSQDRDGSEPLTRTGVRVLTPEYAAPEQLRGEPVGTATDVYALGVVLYELLAGARPSRRLGSGAGSSTSVEPIDPLAPSTAVRRAVREGSGADDMAAARGTTPPRLRRHLQGDLDRIVLKALQHDPARRYRSAQQLLDDLDRYRDGLPVQARPATLAYRARKYVRRHRAVVGPTVAAALVLIAFGAYHAARITDERDRAQAEAAKSQATTQFLQRLLGDAYPSVALGDTFSMNDLLARATARVDSLATQPQIQAELLRTLGDVYREQGRFPEALPLLQRAVALHRSSPQPLDRSAVQALDALGHLQYEAKDYEAAYRSHLESLEISRGLFAEDDSLVLFALNNAAAAASALQRYDEATALHEMVLARHRRLFSDTSQLIHVTHNNLGFLHDNLGNRAEAERAFREAVRIRRMALPPDHPSLALSINNLSTVVRDLGQLDEAELLSREALAMFERVHGPDHHRVGLAAFQLATILERTDHLDEAIPLLRTTLAIDRRTYGSDHLEVGLDLRKLGSVLVKQGDCQPALLILQEAEAVFARNGLPAEDRLRLDVRVNRGACLTALARYAEAEQDLLESYRAVEASVEAPDSVEVRRTLEGLVTLYERWGRGAEAEPYRIRLGSEGAVRP